MRGSPVAAGLRAARAGAAIGRGDWLRILIAALLILFAGLAVTWTLGRIRQQLKEQVGESLRTVVATARGGISLWIGRIQEEESVLTASPEVADAVQERLAAASSGREASASDRNLRRILRPILDKYEYTGFALVVPDGQWITRSGELREKPVAVFDGTVSSALHGQVDVYLAVDPETDEPPRLIVAAPVRSASGGVVAALVLSLDPAGRLADIVRIARPGATGETYVFDRRGRLLTGSRFSKQPPGAPRALTGQGSVNAADAPAHSPSPRIRDAVRLVRLLDRNEWPIDVDVEGHTDYRGIDVLGAWTWANKLDVGIATEIDRDEAMMPYRSILTLTMLMLAAISVSLLALLALLVNRERMLARQYAIEQAVRTRRETLAMVSHDLRSPLNNIMLGASMLPAGLDRQALAHVTSVIERSGRRMQKLIVDLLDISEIEDGRLKIVRIPTDPRTLVEEVRDAFANEASSKRIELAVSCPRDIPPILADHDRIVQVLSNLLGNALKFTPGGGQVAVNAKASGAEVLFEVRDTGPGIAEGQLPHIFQQFWTTASSEKTGLGLGLYIAKTLVEHHGGRIWVDTGRDRGTSFYFTVSRASS